MLKLQNVSKYYHSGDVVALGLRKVSAEFKLGEFIAVTGESGSGKSTLLNVISGLDTYEDGEMYVNGEETSYYSIEEWESYRRQYIGFVFQNYNIIDSYSVYENVMIALMIQGYDPETRRQRALELIKKVGLESHTHHKASKLSGGQKQRAVIARALAKDCPIIVADEPTGNLDSETGKMIIKLLKEISKDKLVIVVTHNYEQVEDYATRKIRLFDGEIVEDKNLKKYEEVEEHVKVPTFYMSLMNLISISLRNLWRTPRRTVFTLIVAMFISLIFFFAYGSYVQSQDSVGSGYNSYFSNTNSSRIVLTKTDATQFTQAELDEIAGINNVLTVMEHDVVWDLPIYNYTEESYGNDKWISTQENYINPAAMLTSDILKKGSAPTNATEVVIEPIEGYDVGDTIELGFSYPECRWDTNTCTIPNATEYLITGIAQERNIGSWRSNAYFHEDFYTNQEIVSRAYFSYEGWGKQPVEPLVEVIYNDSTNSFNVYEGFSINNDLNDGEAIIGYEYLYQLVWMFDLDENILETDPTFYEDMDFELLLRSNFYDNSTPIEVVGYQEFEEGKELESYRVQLNESTLSSIFDDGIYQISVVVRDQYDANQVMEDLSALEYNVMYPAVVTDFFSEAFAIIAGIGMAINLGILLVVLYLISYAVLRNIQNSKKKDYVIFRSIGASKKDLNKVTLIELFITVMWAFALTIVIMFVIQILDTPIPDYLRYFRPVNYFVLILLLTLLSLLLGNRFNRRIFSKSVITSLKGDQ